MLQTPPIPADESRRSRSLSDLGLLRTPPEQRFDRLTRLCARVLGVSGASVVLVARDRVWSKSRVGPFDPDGPRRTSFCAHTMFEKGVSVVPDARRDERFRENPRLEQTPPRIFHMSHPLHAPNGQPVGSLCVMDDEPRDPPAARRETLAHFAAAVEREMHRKLEFSDAESAYIEALENRYLRQLEEAERRARVDPLTEVWNRRVILENLRHEVNRSNREEYPLSVMMLDLDDFKTINDRFGHPVGDSVLKEVASRLVRWTRDYDRIGRYGGDEFLIVLKEADRRASRSVAERIDYNLRRTIQPEADLSIEITPSLGLAVNPWWQKSSAEKLIERADRALYRAKDQPPPSIVLTHPERDAPTAR